MDADDGDVRGRILAAAATLIEQDGVDAATTRAVAAAADVQAPTIYRLFGDKQGLLDAVAEHGLAAYVAAKAKRTPHPDPLQDLRDGWDMHVAFGLAHPALFALMTGDSPATRAGLEVLRQRVRRLARAGRLRIPEDRAVALVHAVGTGTILELLRQPAKTRDRELATTARDAVLAAITTKAPSARGEPVRVAATALRASLADTSVLSAGERLLLDELLARIAG